MDTYDTGGGATGATPPTAPTDTGSDDAGSDSYTCFLPSDFPGADALKPGDTITMKVVGKDKDGDLEVEHVAGGSDEQSSDNDKSYMDDLEATMAEKG